MVPLAHSVAEVDHAVGESPVVQQLQVEAHAPRQCRLAATNDDGAHQQHALIDQSVPEGFCRDPGAADAQVCPGGLLEPPHRLGIEVPLESRLR